MFKIAPEALPGSSRSTDAVHRLPCFEVDKTPTSQQIAMGTVRQGNP